MINTDDIKTIKKAKIVIETFSNRNNCDYKQLFLHQETVQAKNHDLDILVDLGIVEKSGKEYLSHYMIYPIEDVFIISDFPSLREHDRVFPIFDDESVLLAQKLRVHEGEIGLDIGTGSGIYAIFGAKKGAKRIIATDINWKVKSYFDFNAILNAVDDKVEFVLGDVYGKLENEKFDFLVSNPPFVPTPHAAHFYIHSNGGVLGVEVIRAIFERKDDYLKQGGRIQMLVLSLGQKDIPLIVKELSSYFRKENVEIVLSELYESPLNDISLFLNCFEEAKSFSEWKQILMVEGYTKLHYFYIEINPADEFSINLRRNEKPLEQTHYSGSWKGRVGRYSLPKVKLNREDASRNERKQISEVFVS